MKTAKEAYEEMVAAENKIPTLLRAGSEEEKEKYIQDQEDRFCSYFIEFAKLHVEKALTMAHSQMQLPLEDLEFTLSAYPLENIK